MNKRQRKKIRHEVHVVTGVHGMVFGVHRSLRAAMAHTAMLSKQVWETGNGKRERECGIGTVSIRMGDMLDWDC